MGIRIGIVGSREFKNLQLVKDLIYNNLSFRRQDYNDYFTIITGGAVDKFVEKICKEIGMGDVQIIRPVNEKDKLSYLFRNVEIVTLSDEIYAFWDGKSKGTKFVIDYAKKRNKKIEVIMDGGWHG